MSRTKTDRVRHGDDVWRSSFLSSFMNSLCRDELFMLSLECHLGVYFLSCAHSSTNIILYLYNLSCACFRSIFYSISGKKDCVMNYISRYFIKFHKISIPTTFILPIIIAIHYFVCTRNTVISWFDKLYAIELPIIRKEHNSYAPGQNGHYFANDKFKCICMNEMFCVLIKISLKFVARGPFGNNPALV